MNEKRMEMLKYLRLSGLAANWDQYLDVAAKSNFSNTRLLDMVIEREYKLKKENSRKMRINRARIPEKLVMETFPFDRQANLKKKKVIDLYDRFEYMQKHRNMIWVGPTGVGKTGLATAFLIQAINRGYNGRFILFSEIVELLYKSVADHSEEKLIKTFAAYDCLLIDELGYVQVEPVQVGLFFTLMQKRHGRKTTLITSNLGFDKWGSFLKNDHLTAALIDRLTEKSHVINMKKCRSLRVRLDQ
ncbi:MAG: ATP-binding protein [bacterium]|nr:ATP-binding protein [bacterium]